MLIICGRRVKTEDVYPDALERNDVVLDATGKPFLVKDINLLDGFLYQEDAYGNRTTLRLLKDVTITRIVPAVFEEEK